MVINWRNNKLLLSVMFTPVVAAARWDSNCRISSFSICTNCYQHIIMSILYYYHIIDSDTRKIDRKEGRKEGRFGYLHVLSNHLFLFFISWCNGWWREYTITETQHERFVKFWVINKMWEIQYSGGQQNASLTHSFGHGYLIDCV